jgi:hypothetical protein
MPKSMIARDFSARGSLEKIFTLSFPGRQGTGEAALPCPLAPLLRRRGTFAVAGGPDLFSDVALTQPASKGNAMKRVLPSRSTRTRACL